MPRGLSKHTLKWGRKKTHHRIKYCCWGFHLKKFAWEKKKSFLLLRDFWKSFGINTDTSLHLQKVCGRSFRLSYKSVAAKIGGLLCKVCIYPEFSRFISLSKTVSLLSCKAFLSISLLAFVVGWETREGKILSFNKELISWSLWPKWAKLPHRETNWMTVLG